MLIHVVRAFAVIVVAHELLLAQAVAPQPAWLARPITIRMRDSRVSDIVEALQKAAGFTIDISRADAEMLNERITIDMCRTPTGDALRAALAAAGLAFKITEKTVNIFKPATVPQRIPLEACEDRMEEILRPLRGTPPPPFELPRTK